MALTNHAVNLLQKFGAHADLFQRQHVARFVEQAQHDSFAESGGQGRDAYVHIFAGDAYTETPILGQTLLSDIQVGHDLDAAADACLGLGRWTQNLIQDAVDAIANHQLGFKGFDVDIAGSLFVRLGQHAVDEADDRTFIGSVQQIGWFQFAGQAAVAAVADFFSHVLCFAGMLFIAAVDGP